MFNIQVLLVDIGYPCQPNLHQKRPCIISPESPERAAAVSCCGSPAKSPLRSAAAHPISLPVVRGGRRAGSQSLAGRCDSDGSRCVDCAVLELVLTI